MKVSSATNVLERGRLQVPVPEWGSTVRQQKGGIYRHFASKEELAAEAFDYTWETAWKTRLLHVDEKAKATKAGRP